MLVHAKGKVVGQKIKQDDRICIESNIREIRSQRGIGQTEMVQLFGETMTRETLVKIERGDSTYQSVTIKSI